MLWSRVFLLLPVQNFPSLVLLQLSKLTYNYSWSWELSAECREPEPKGFKNPGVGADQKRPSSAALIPVPYVTMKNKWENKQLFLTLLHVPGHVKFTFVREDKYGF